jgi:hypothetical protein
VIVIDCPAVVDALTAADDANTGLDCPMLTRDGRLRKSAGHHARIDVL